MIREPTNKDAASIDAVIAALYDVISGAAGVPREWDRLRSLFFSGGRLMRTGVAENGGVNMTAMEVEEFIAAATDVFQQQDFFERELARRVDRFGHIAQVFSTFETTTERDGGQLLGRGINSIQLWFDERRWWVMSMLWDEERAGQEIQHEIRG